jgi:integrase
MPRPSKPYRRTDVQGCPWYGRVRGRKVWLAPGEATLTEARRELARALLAEPREASRGGLTVRDVLNLFLFDAFAAIERGEIDPKTFRQYRTYGLKAREAIGDRPCADLKPAEVSRWVDGQGWGPTTRCNAVTAVKRAFRWAVDAGHLERSPLATLKRPTAKRRTAVLSPDQIRQVLELWPEGHPFRLFTEALHQTGCRPGEARNLTVDRVDLEAGAWRVRDKIRRKTGSEFRSVYLSPRAVEVTRAAMGGRSEGYVFLNQWGRQWSESGLDHRFRQAAERLGIPRAACVAYAFRHDFVTSALERGVPPATVAELVGHRGLSMIMRVYSHLHSRTEHLREAARDVRRNPE